MLAKKLAIIISITILGILSTTSNVHAEKVTTSGNNLSGFNDIVDTINYVQVKSGVKETKTEVISDYEIKIDDKTGELVQVAVGDVPEAPEGGYQYTEFSPKFVKNKSFTISEDEYETLCRIVEAEVTGGDAMSKNILANVILNRYHSGKYSSIHDVVFAPRQFSPVQDGRYYTVRVTDSTVEAVDKALDGEDYSQGAVFFLNKKHSSSKNVAWFENKLDYLFDYGGHSYYKYK